MPKQKTNSSPKIINSQWSKKEVEIGEKVRLEAETQNAEGKTAAFQIYEYRKKNRLIKEVKVPIRESKVRTLWKVKYIPDLYGVEPPEFRFRISIGEASRTSNTLCLKTKIVDIALTFDDGPHAAKLGTGKNRTEKILKILKKNNVKAAFFIQTHAPARADSLNGRKIVVRMAKEGHIIGIHTGSFEDHVEHSLRVKQKPEDINGDGKFEGTNGLETDLIRAKLLIEKLSGRTPEFVRAPYGRYKANAEIPPTYKRQQLVHIGWDIDSLDNKKANGKIRNPEQVKEALKNSLEQSDLDKLIILFHDLNPITVKNLEDYIRIIVKTISGIGKIPKFPSQTKQLQILLKVKGIG